MHFCYAYCDQKVTGEFRDLLFSSTSDEIVFPVMKHHCCCRGPGKQAIAISRKVGLIATYSNFKRKTSLRKKILLRNLHYCLKLLLEEIEAPLDVFEVFTAREDYLA